MYATMRPNTSSGSSRASLRMEGSEEEMLGPIHEHVQGRGREDGGSLPENGAVGYAGDGGKNHVAPVGQGLGSVVEVCAGENDAGVGEHAARVLCVKVRGWNESDGDTHDGEDRRGNGEPHQRQPVIPG